VGAVTGSGRPAVAAGRDHAADPLGRITAMIDAGFLAEMGWDPDRLVLAPPPGHRLVVRPVCRVEGCSNTAPGRRGICAACGRRLSAAGLADDQAELVGRARRPRRLPVLCLVARCGRERASGPAALCRTHAGQRDALGVTTAEFVVRSDVVALAPNGPCAVAACPRQRRHPDGLYCDAHQQRLRAARRQDPRLDEAHFRRTEPAVGVGGQVSLRGLAPLVVAQVLYGLQQRCRLERVQTKEADLRCVCDNLRRQQVTTVDDHVLGGATTSGSSVLPTRWSPMPAEPSPPPRPRSPATNGTWRCSGSGTVSFDAISQRWLRESAKRWAADDLPRRRIRPGRRTGGGLAVRHHVNCVAMLSEALRARADRGENPGALGRTDMEAFLNRLAYLESAGRISGDARLRAAREVRAVLGRIRAMGLTRPGQVAARLGEDFAVGRDDVPDTPEPAEAGRALPPEVMRQLCARLGDISSPEMGCATELAIATGRRPEEICDLPYDCLVRDDDGGAVLVFDNHKANRLGRRLPISEATPR